MSEGSKAVEEAIAKRIAEMTAVANEGKAEEAQLEAMMGWQAVPADITDDQMAMIAVVAQGNPMIAAQMNQDVLKSIFTTLNDISKNDQPRIQSIMQKAQAFQTKERLQPGLSLQLVSAELSPRVSRLFTVAAVLVSVDDDLNVAVLEKADFDTCLNIYVTPRNATPTQVFNTAVQYTKAGDALKPLATTAYYDEVNAQGEVSVHVNGHMLVNGKPSPVAMIATVKAPTQNAPMIHPVKPGNPAP